MSSEDDTIRFPEANISAVAGIAGALATTFGPTPNDKFVGKEIGSRNDPDPYTVPYDDYVVTSDGASILEALPLEHPIAPVVRRIAGPEIPGESGTDGEQIVDGTTGTFILTASLLHEAGDLIEKGLHPTEIRRGYLAGLSVSREALSAARQPLSAFGNQRDTELAVARTAMTGNDVGGRGEMWAEFAVEAARTVGYPTPGRFGIEQVKAGSIADSQLIRGTVLPRNEVAHDEMPTSVSDATVLVLEGYKREDAGDGRVGGLRDPELQADATIQLDADTDASAFEAVHVKRRQRIIESLLEHDIDVVVSRLGINDAFMRLLVEHDIMAIRSVNRVKLERIARSTGAVMLKDPEDIQASDLGTAGVVEQQFAEKRHGRRKRRRIILFDDCPAPESVTVLLRGSWSDLADEATRELRKATAAVATARGDGDHPDGVVPGGGGVDMGVSREVRAAAPRDSSRSQLAMEAFADAVEKILWGLAKNGGLDPLGTLADLRAAAADGYEVGIRFPDGDVGNVTDANVFDPYATKASSYKTAVQVTNLILGIDDAIDAEFTETPADEGDAIFDDRAEKHADHLEEEGTEGTVWG
jgi:chaperonin GroEL (HSP60 family)